jgi:DNL zinc finger
MAYQKGMVVAICKGCDAKHWIADNLDPTLASNNIEELFAAGGDGDDNQRVNRVTREVYDIERVWEFNAGEITDNEGNPVLE